MGSRSSSRSRRALILCVAVLITAAGACDDSARRTPAHAADDTAPIVVYNAAALPRPMRAGLDSFQARTGVRYEQETGASLELARKVTELGSEPDVLALADPDLFPRLLEPRFTTWHALFARNRIVLAYTARSRAAAEITGANWFQILSRRGVEIGRGPTHRPIGLPDAPRLAAGRAPLPRARSLCAYARGLTAE